MFKHFLKDNISELIFVAACAAIYFIVFALYKLPLGAVLYPTMLCAIVAITRLIYRGIKAYNKHRNFELLSSIPDNLSELLKIYKKQDDEDYRRIIELLEEERTKAEEKYSNRFEDRMQYFTIWVHQIKTPIASMRLRLEKEDTHLSRRLSEDLFRIEQYVEMVLTYLRLNSETTDYVFSEIDLDSVIKGVLRKYAGMFISKGLSVKFTESCKKVVTDEKWFALVLEQLLSNAIKYTEQGSVSIYMDGDRLCIRDTGIGVDARDLPRIFEKGYTGYNGRNDKRATGIGLYLAKKICRSLGFEISAESTVGEGTCMMIDLTQTRADVE